MSKYSFNASLPTFSGIPMIGGMPIIYGNWYWVDYGNGSDSVSTKANSMKRPWQTIDKAYDTCTTNKGDGIALIGNTTHTLTEMLDFSKNRITVFGVDSVLRKYGQNAKISLGVTTAATDIGTIKNTGVRNAFVNVKVMNSNTVAQGIYSFVEGGEYTVIDHCEIYKETDLDQTGASELVMNGDSTQITNSTIGSLANFQTGTTIRPGMLMTQGLAGTGKVCRDLYVANTNFWKNAGHVNGRHVYGANATDVERIAVFENCTFVNAVNAAAVPAQCIAFGSTLTVGQVLVADCNSINNTKLSTTTGVLISGAVPTYATSGIAVQS